METTYLVKKPKTKNVSQESKLSCYNRRHNSGSIQCHDNVLPLGATTRKVWQLGLHISLSWVAILEQGLSNCLAGLLHFASLHVMPQKVATTIHLEGRCWKHCFDRSLAAGGATRSATDTFQNNLLVSTFLKNSISLADALNYESCFGISPAGPVNSGRCLKQQQVS